MAMSEELNYEQCSKCGNFIYRREDICYILKRKYKSNDEPKCAVQRNRYVCVDCGTERGM